MVFHLDALILVNRVAKLQSYSYVVNNPLSLSDPTGFNMFGDFFNWLNDTLGSTGAQIVIGVAAIAVGVVTAGNCYRAQSALLGVEVAALQGTLACRRCYKRDRRRRVARYKAGRFNLRSSW
jgi:hypothetical protein